MGELSFAIESASGDGRDKSDDGAFGERGIHLAEFLVKRDSHPLHHQSLVPLLKRFNEHPDFRLLGENELLLVEAHQIAHGRKVDNFYFHDSLKRVKANSGESFGAFHRKALWDFDGVG